MLPLKVHAHTHILMPAICTLLKMFIIVSLYFICRVYIGCISSSVNLVGLNAIELLARKIPYWGEGSYQNKCSTTLQTGGRLYGCKVENKNNNYKNMAFKSTCTNYIFAYIPSEPNNQTAIHIHIHGNICWLVHCWIIEPNTTSQPGCQPSVHSASPGARYQVPLHQRYMCIEPR